jgi:hypothetical protein
LVFDALAWILIKDLPEDCAPKKERM